MGTDIWTGMGEVVTLSEAALFLLRFAGDAVAAAVVEVVEALVTAAMTVDAALLREAVGDAIAIAIDGGFSM